MSIKRVRMIAALICVSVMLSLWMVPEAQASGAPRVSAKSYVLLDAGTGTVLLERNADVQMLIASTTKIMTAVVTLEHAHPDDLVEIRPEHTGIEGSSMYLRAGETMTVRDLLYGLMLASGNDAAVALAYHVAGGIEEFAVLMNEKAGALGMTNSSFRNPHGLDAEGHYSTARDMAILAAFAMESEDFVEIVSTRSARAAGRSLVNHNKMLWRYPGAEGVKTGYTRASGRSLVSAASRDRTRLICVTLSAPRDWADHTALLDWGFAHYRYHGLFVQGEVVATVPVISGMGDSVELVAEACLKLLTGVEDEVAVVIEAPRFVYASVAAGDQGGRVLVMVNGEQMLETRLLYQESVELDQTNRLSFWEEVRWRFGLVG
ncbi:MAG: D-alanyl-D-alanine carboxypeptidase [Oscillospiraceae bacterium]|nr:D-alanyl-D-alanine carboxypeptidase [Oscillospiraceae bacterium]